MVEAYVIVVISGAAVVAALTGSMVVTIELKIEVAVPLTEVMVDMKVIVVMAGDMVAIVTADEADARAEETDGEADRAEETADIIEEADEAAEEIVAAETKDFVGAEGEGADVALISVEDALGTVSVETTGTALEGPIKLLLNTTTVAVEEGRASDTECSAQ